MPEAQAVAGPGGPPAGERPGDGIWRRQVWLTLFRLVLVTVLLGGTAAWQWGEVGPGGDLAWSPLYGVVLVTYVLSLALALALRMRILPGAVAIAQICLDVGLALAVVALTGWADSVFVFLFAIAIVTGALLLDRRGAILSAALSITTYPALALLLPARPAPLPTLFAHAGALVATAALAAYLAEQLRRTRERLFETEVDLAQITALHESIVQSVASGMLTLDAAGRVTFLNRAGEQITGWRLAEVQSRPATWLPELPASASRDEVDFVDARGKKLRLGYTLFPLRDREGVEIGRAVIFQDLTRLREMEEQAQRTERLADLGRVAAGLAHELRNPLASMAGSVELLRGGASLGEEDRRLMDIVLREASRLDQLVTRFLEYSRPATPRRARADLARVAAETLEVFSHDPAAARVRLEPDLAPTPTWCDPDQLRQVLWNLLLNAAQAAPREGEPVAVRVHCRPDEGGGAMLEVADAGPGIAPEDLAQVFTPFFTTKARGSGLGLATVQRIIDAHGGAVAAASEPGQGARFTVRLPPPPASAAGPGPG